MSEFGGVMAYCELLREVGDRVPCVTFGSAAESSYASHKLQYSMDNSTAVGIDVYWRVAQACMLAWRSTCESLEPHALPPGALQTLLECEVLLDAHEFQGEHLGGGGTRFAPMRRHEWLFRTYVAPYFGEA